MIAINIAKYVFENKNKNKSAKATAVPVLYCSVLGLSYICQMSTKKKQKSKNSESSSKNQEVMYLKMFLVFITYYSFVIHYSVCTLLLFFRILVDL